MSLQRCVLVLGILVCYSLSTLEAIDCERFVFYPACRGSQSKRSSVQQSGDVKNYRNERMLDELFGIADDTRVPLQSRNGIANKHDKSKLLTALLDRGVNPDAVYDWYVSHVDRNERRNQKWGQDYSSDQRLLDEDY